MEGDFIDELEKQETTAGQKRTRSESNKPPDNPPEKKPHVPPPEEQPPAPPPPPAELNEGQWNELTDVWCRLIHIDVHKDHDTNYNSDIVNKFLPYNKYKSNFFDASGSEISKDGMDKDGIFNAVVDTQISTINDTEYNGQSSIKIHVTGYEYDYKAFKIAEGQEEANTLASTIQTFIGPHTFSAFIDTSNKTEKLIGSLPADTLNILYAYTSAVENDAAGKMNKRSVRGREFALPNYNQFLEKFYLEKEPEQFMKSTVTYPPFGNLTRMNGLSHVMCKYPIILELHSGTNYEDGKLNVILTYIKGEHTVSIQEGENIATKRRNSIQTLSGQRMSPQKLEKIFISKYHGDIGQVLEMYRNIELVNTDSSGNVKRTETTGDRKSCFVSIDLNAILKGFTEGIDLVFYYINASNKLIVFKNNNLNSPEIILANMKKQAESLYDSVSQEIEEYNYKIGEINATREKFYKKIDTLLKEKPEGENSIDKYKNAIALGIRIATLITFLPKDNIQVIEKPEGISSDNLKREITKLTDKRKEMVIPSEYMKLKVMNGEELAKTHIENELIFTVRGHTSGKFLSTIQFRNLPGLPDSNSSRNIESSDKRIASKLQTYLGIDVIKYVYNILHIYNKHTDFITHLKSAIDEEDIQSYLNTVLKISGMEAPSRGGTRYSNETRIKKRNNKNTTSKVKHLQKGGEDLDSEILQAELNDIEKLIRYYKEYYTDDKILEETRGLLLSIHNLVFIGEQEEPATLSLAIPVQSQTQNQSQISVNKGEEEEEYFQEGVRFVSTFPYIRTLYELLTSYKENTKDDYKERIDGLLDTLLSLSYEEEPTNPSGTNAESVVESVEGSVSTDSNARGPEKTPPRGSPNPQSLLLSPQRLPTRRGGAKSLKKSKKQKKQRKSNYPSRTAKKNK